MGVTDIYALHEKIKSGRRKYIGSKYYDYPDGEDLIGKLAFTTKWSGIAGTFLGVLDTIREPPPPTIGAKLTRCMIFAIPPVAVAATFTCVTYYATVLRKKDDPCNYALGGLAAGFVLGPMFGATAGFWGGFYFAVCGVIKKYYQMKGETVFGIPNYKYMTSYYLRNLDTSIVAEKKGNWTKELPTD